MVLNARFQFLVLYTAGPEARAAAAACPTADGHRAMESGAVGKVLVDVPS
ncbi:hypothetical protein [Streptomyces mirabilis]